MNATISEARIQRDEVRHVIQAFERVVGDDHDITLRVVTATGVTFRVEKIGTAGAMLVTFMGHDDQGEPVWAIQHLNQMNMSLSAKKKSDSAKPATRIIFTV